MKDRKSPAARPVPPTKDEIALLPRFAGLPQHRIYTPKTSAECEAAVLEIMNSGLTGFDTESRPTFVTGEQSTGPHIVQFALFDKAFIFQLHREVCVQAAAELIASARVLKVGFGLRNDRGQIRDKLGVSLHATGDLDHVFRQKGYQKQIGVRTAMAVVLRSCFRKPKAITTSNWAAEELSPRQLRYAANDAFAALKIKEALDLQDS